MNNFFPKWNQDRIVYSWQNDKLRIGADDNDVLEIKGNSIFGQILFLVVTGIIVSKTFKNY